MSAMTARARASSLPMTMRSGMLEVGDGGAFAQELGVGVTLAS